MKIFRPVLFFVVSFVACLAATEITPAPSPGGADSEAKYQKARALIQGETVRANQMEEAAALMKSAADEGHVEALGALGYLYATGLGVRKDPVQAIQCYRLAADGGSLKAQLNLGLVLARPSQAYTDQVEGVRWIRKAADAGLPQAKAALAQIYVEGDLEALRQDYKQAYELALAAAESGNASAQKTLGVLFQYGFGVHKDTAAAAKWYERSALQGNARAAASLGLLLGLNNPASRVQALSWLLRAGDQGDVLAQKTLEETLPHLPPATVEEAREMAARRN